MTAHAPFSALPPHGQKIIHDIYALLHQHKQTMSSVSTMIPSALFTVTHTADQAAGGIDGASTVLSSRLMDLNEMLKELIIDMERESHSVDLVLHESQELYKLTHQCAVYPVQNIARRRNIALPPSTTTGGFAAVVNEGGNSSILEKLNTLLQENSSQVDRLEGLPSLYLWRTMENLHERNENLYYRINCMKNLLNGRKRLMGEMGTASGDGIVGYKEHRMEELSFAMQMQVENLVRVAGIVGKLNERIEELKLGYKRYIAKQTFQRDGLAQYGSTMKSGIGIGIGEGDFEGSLFLDRGVATFDPFAEADRKELEYKRRVEIEARRRAIEASKAVPSMSSSTPSTPAPAPTGGGLFGSSTPAPAPSTSGFSFGGSTTPAPAPAGGGLFGSSTPAPAPSTGAFSFGGSATPAPAPAGGGLFGSSTPAPAPSTSGFSFGGSATPAPAPAGAGLFGSSAPAPSTSGFSFGGSSTPAPAPASGGLFGSSTPAPAPSSTGTGFSFGGSTSGTPAPSSGGFSFGNTAAPASGTLFSGPATSAPVPSSLKSRRKAGRRR
jgi:hypothetical protein